jgi:hypothetical protein
MGRGSCNAELRWTSRLWEADVRKAGDPADGSTRYAIFVPCRMVHRLERAGQRRLRVAFPFPVFRVTGRLVPL